MLKSISLSSYITLVGKLCYCLAITLGDFDLAFVLVLLQVLDIFIYYFLSNSFVI